MACILRGKELGPPPRTSAPRVSCDVESITYPPTSPGDGTSSDVIYVGQLSRSTQ